MSSSMTIPPAAASLLAGLPRRPRSHCSSGRVDLRSTSVNYWRVCGDCSRMRPARRTTKSSSAFRKCRLARRWRWVRSCRTSPNTEGSRDDGGPGATTAGDDAMYQSVNPYNGDVLQRFDDHSDPQMWSALGVAHRAFHDQWSRASYQERAKIVGAAASLMEERAQDLARLATLEMGKRIGESRDEVSLSASILKFYAENAERFLASQTVESQSFDASTEYSPLGVLLGVQPWNYPYYQLARFAAPNLMAGNTLLVKHAPGVPQCALAFEKILHDAGAPPGTYTNVFLSNEQ